MLSSVEFLPLIQTWQQWVCLGQFLQILHFSCTHAGQEMNFSHTSKSTAPKKSVRVRSRISQRQVTDLWFGQNLYENGMKLTKLNPIYYYADQPLVCELVWETSAGIRLIAFGVKTFLPSTLILLYSMGKYFASFSGLLLDCLVLHLGTVLL